MSVRSLFQHQIFQDWVILKSMQAIYMHGINQNRTDDAISTTILPDALGSTANALIALLIQGYFVERGRSVRGLS